MSVKNKSLPKPHNIQEAKKLRVSGDHLSGYLTAVQKTCGLSSTTQALFHVLEVAKDFDPLTAEITRRFGVK